MPNVKAHLTTYSVHEEVVGTILTRDGWVRKPVAVREKAARIWQPF